MTGLGRPNKPEDPQQLRSAAVDALKDAARQSDPREFSRLTRHALALIERARAIGHGRPHPALETAASQVTSRDDQVKPRPFSKIIEFVVRLWRRSA
jgi:hypothetical protein